MKLYLDTADVSQIDRYLATGLFSGVTTNPAILKAGGFDPASARELYTRIVAASGTEVFLQTFGATIDDQFSQALRYRELGPEVVVKVVCSAMGLAVCARLERQGVPVLLTAIHDAKQIIPAMTAGATYVTPCLSEIYRTWRDGSAQVSSMLRILRATPNRTKLLVAGLHNTATMVRLVEEGLEYLTVTPEFADTLFAQNETEAVAARFEQIAAA